MDPTKGSYGLGSFRSSRMALRRYSTPSAGFQLLLSMSKQTSPFELMLQWYTRVRNVNLGAVNG